MIKHWNEIINDLAQTSNIPRPAQTYAWYVYSDGIGTKYNIVNDIPVKYRKIAIREETKESKISQQLWASSTKSLQNNAYTIWLNLLRNEHIELTDKQFNIILNYVTKLSSDRDNQANYFSELSELIHEFNNK
jgi:hypothetical protein